MPDFEIIGHAIGSIAQDAMYESFEEWDDPRNNEIFPVLVKKASDLIGGQANVLDLGCGSGRLGGLLRDSGSVRAVYAIDQNSENVAMAQSYVGTGKVAQGRAQNISELFPGVQFSVIVANALFEPEVLMFNEPNMMQMLKAIYTSLEPGGHLVASGYLPLLIERRHLKEVGFKVKQCAIPRNAFNDSNPKQLYVAQKV